MGKVWGYSKKQEGRLSGMLSKQTIGRGKRRRQVLMKLPKVFDIQRMVLSKHLTRLNRYSVYCAKMVDVNFEDKVEEFKKNAIIAKSYNSRLRKNRQQDTTENELQNTANLGIFDFDKMRYNSLPRYVMSHLIQQRSEDQKAKDEVQRIRWRTPFIRDQISNVMNEVYAMNRLVTQNCHSFALYQHPYTVFLESSHYALKTHQWPKVALSLSGILQVVGISQKFRFPEKRMGSITVSWMHGLLALVNYYKDNVQLVKQYAECMRSLFYTYPVWLGLQTAAWFIQKGYFLEGHAILTEHSTLPPAANYSLETWKNSNIKRKQTNFVADFINAVKLYCEWRKESTLLEDNQQSLDEFGPLRDSVQRKGEAALTAYEVLYEQQKRTKADVMCFLEVFVELLVKYRSPNRALEVLQDIIDANDGNLVVEDFFVQFLENYANVCDIPEGYLSQIKERWQHKTNYDEQEGLALKRLKTRRQIRRLRAEKKKIGIVRTFKKVDNPGFSW